MTFTLIQAMRGLLAVGVVYAHSLMFLAKYGGDQQYLNYIPVIIGGIPCMFFSISGFFMAMLIDRESPDFLKQRLLRVYPTYFLIIAFAFLVRGMTNMPLSFSNIFAVLSLLPFGKGFDYKLGIEWTMLYEVFFYFVCAVFCRVGWYNRFPAFLLFWFMATLAGTFFLDVPPMPSLLNIWLSVWNIGFIGGALIYYFLKDYNSKKVQVISLLVTFVTLCTTLSLPWGHVNLLLVIGLGSVLLTGLLIKAEYFFQAPRFFIKVGDYSYALYLVHVTIILTTLDSWMRFSGTKPTLMVSICGMAAALLISWPLGIMDMALHKYLKAKLKRFLAKKRAKKLLLTEQPEVASPSVVGTGR